MQKRQYRGYTIQFVPEQGKYEICQRGEFIEFADTLVQATDKIDSYRKDVK